MFICLAIYGTFTLTTGGCGSNEPVIIEPVGEPTMSAEVKSAYEEQMRKGGSSKPGN